MSSAREQQRSNIHRTVRCVGFVFGNKVEVTSYCETDGFEESFVGDFRNADDVTGVLHSCGVLIRSEDTNLGIRVTESCGCEKEEVGKSNLSEK